jgi:TonB family protein
MEKVPGLALLIALALLPTVLDAAAWPAEDSSKSDKLSAYLAAGTEALNAGEYKKARRSFSKAEELSNGTSPSALLGLATAYLRLGDLGNALRYGEEGLNRVEAPIDKAIAENLMGTILSEETPGRSRSVEEKEAALANAEARFRRALDLSKGELIAAWGNLSFVLEQQHRFTEAMKAEEEYLEREPEDRTSRSRLCWLQYLLSTTVGADASATGRSQRGSDSAVVKEDPPFRLGDDVLPPRKLVHPSARYTAAARQERVQGLVIAEVVINRRGFVQDVKVIEALPLGLTEQTVRALCQWQFDPATRNGVPVEVNLGVTTRFSLEDGE